MARHKPYNDLDVDDGFVLPEGNVARGQLLFKKHCSQCHTIRRDGCNPYGSLLGPNLYGVMGRTAAQNQRTGWSKYSDSLQDSGILWTERNMMAFLKNPRAFAGGAINMNFRGIESVQDRVDIIHYLKRAGHESWMVLDGTPHSQRQWWARDGGSASTQSYWEANATSKQLKPWQHITRAVSSKVSDLKEQALENMGYANQAAAPPEVVSQGASFAAAAWEDPEAKRWRKVSKVVDGVQSASREQSFNWPLPEEIAAGPVRKNVKAVTAPAKAVVQEELSRAKLVFCEESSEAERRCPALPGGQRAPSGLMVYADTGGPRAKASQLGLLANKMTKKRTDGFVPASSFQGSKAGMVFKLGPSGLGYYPDVFQPPPTPAGAT